MSLILLPVSVDSRRSFPALDCDPCSPSVSPRIHSGSFCIRFLVHSVPHFGLVPSNITDRGQMWPPSIEVSDFFTHEPLYFDVMANTERIEKCTTCMESEDLLDILDEILITLEDVNAEVANTPERLRLRKRQPASPQKDVPSKKQAKSERKLPTHPPPLAISKTLRLLEEGESTAEESSEEVGSAKSAKPVVAPSSSASKAAESACAPGTSQKDDGFTTVGRNGKRIAPIMIDAQSNATELLTQIGNLCNNTSLEGRFENGKLRVFPNFCRRAPYHPEICLGQKNAVPHIRDGPQ
ncbi:hypothetical protein TNCV_1190361 [Trichonephila clavipes]|nr:hypothetical protein TNCV_1190361 [Trichonephila clavipes]